MWKGSTEYYPGIFGSVKWSLYILKTLIKLHLVPLDDFFLLLFEGN